MEHYRFPPEQLSIVGKIQVQDSSDFNVRNISLVANTETSITLHSNVQQFIIRSRDLFSFKIKKVSSGDYLTVSRGCSLSLNKLDFNARIIYVECSQNTTIELLELFY